MYIKIFNLSLVIFLLLAVAFLQPAHAGSENKKQNVIVKLSHFDAFNWEDPTKDGHNWQPACMALMMTDHVLGKKVGKRYKNKVTLFLALEAVELADKDTATDLSVFTCMNGQTLQDRWDDLVNKGVDIAVCPGCAKIGGITPDTLREGAFIPNGAPEVTRIFLKADKIIDF
jgi:predicted peroxiredoxin